MAINELNLQYMYMIVSMLTRLNGDKVFEFEFKFKKLLSI